MVLLCQPQPEGSAILRGSLHCPASAHPQPSPLHHATGQRPHQWPWEGGEGAGRPRQTAAAAAARRGRGGAAPPPPSPNRVSGGAARVCLRAHQRGPNSLHRSRPPRRSGCPRPAGPRPRGRSTWARARLSARPRPSPRNSPPDLPAGCARRGVRDGQLRARSGSARYDLPSPRRWVWRSRSCYPETEGRKTAPAARPSRRGSATAGNKGDKAASAGPSSAPSTPSRRAALPPRAARIRPEAARRAGCAAPAPRDPACRSRGIRVCEGPGGGGCEQPLSLSGGCCTPAVAMATRTCRARAQLGAWAVRPAPPGLTCAPLGTRRWPRFPSAGGRGHGGPA